jgi:hypothetical protein
MVPGCTKFYRVQDGDGCWAITDAQGIELDELYTWNPAIGPDCASLWPGYYVCVELQSGTSATTPPLTSTSPGPGNAAPGPTQGGIPANYNRWVM